MSSAPPPPPPRAGLPRPRAAAWLVPADGPLGRPGRPPTRHQHHARPRRQRHPGRQRLLRARPWSRLPQRHICRPGVRHGLQLGFHHASACPVAAQPAHAAGALAPCTPCVRQRPCSVRLPAVVRQPPGNVLWWYAACGAHLQPRAVALCLRRRQPLALGLWRRQPLAFTALVRPQP